EVNADTWPHIEEVLKLTLDGLKDILDDKKSDENRIYLFTPDSSIRKHPNQPKVKKGDTVKGYVMTTRFQKGDGSFTFEKGADFAKKMARPVVSQYHKDPDAEFHNLNLEKTPAKTGHIHLNFESIQSDQVDKIACDIIHEATHRFAGTGDFVYKFKD